MKTNNNKLIIFILLVAALVAIYFVAKKSPVQTPGNTNTEAPTPAGNEHIRIFTPLPNAVLDSTQTTALSGEAYGYFFEASFPIRLTDDKGNVIETVLASPDGEWMVADFVKFNASLKPFSTNATKGFIVFQKDNASGLPEHDESFSLPVQFGNATSDVKLYFGNKITDPAAMKCDVAYPVTHTIKKIEAIGAATLAELLRGPTDAEKADGYFTSIPVGTKLNSLTIDGAGVAHADFSSELKNVAGSCLVSQIRAQIEDTIKQFPTVSSVIVSVDGSTNGVLEP